MNISNEMKELIDCPRKCSKIFLVFSIIFMIPVIVAMCNWISTQTNNNLYEKTVVKIIKYAPKEITNEYSDYEISLEYVIPNNFNNTKKIIINKIGYVTIVEVQINGNMTESKNKLNKLYPLEGHFIINCKIPPENIFECCTELPDNKNNLNLMVLLGIIDLSFFIITGINFCLHRS